MESGCHGDCSLFLDPEVERLRWFLLPREATAYLTGHQTTPPATPPFTPRRYGNSNTGPGSHSSNLKPLNGMKLEHGSSNEVDSGTRPSPESVLVSRSGIESRPKFHLPPKTILRPTIEVPYSHTTHTHTQGSQGTQLTQVNTEDTGKHREHSRHREHSGHRHRETQATQGSQGTQLTQVNTEDTGKHSGHTEHREVSNVTMTSS